jgi:hypothetical protein
VCKPGLAARKRPPLCRIAVFLNDNGPPTLTKALARRRRNPKPNRRGRLLVFSVPETYGRETAFLVRWLRSLSMSRHGQERAGLV